MAERRGLYVLGAGGLAREMAQLARQIAASGGTSWEIAGFIGGSDDEVGRDLGFGSVVGTDEWLLAGDRRAELVLGIGHPAARAEVAARYGDLGGRFAFPNLVHPTAVFDPVTVALGRGNCVTAGCIFTCDIEIGDFNLFNLHTTVGHDARIGSSNVINPSANLSGGTRLGDRILVGTGAQILEGLTVGHGATIGAGAVVTKDVPPGVTAVGIPARPVEN
jgi:sugar O-acyltransferase (sialic acid O-acetyltransferase NeuD family)